MEEKFVRAGDEGVLSSTLVTLVIMNGDRVNSFLFLFN